MRKIEVREMRLREMEEKMEEREMREREKGEMKERWKRKKMKEKGERNRKRGKNLTYAFITCKILLYSGKRKNKNLDLLFTKEATSVTGSSGTG